MKFLTAKVAKPASAKATAGKSCAKHTKLNPWLYFLCDLCVISLRSLRFIDLNKDDAYFDARIFSGLFKSIGK